MPPHSPPPPSPSSLAHARQRLGHSWRSMARRERRLVLMAVAVVLSALVWALLLAPALRTLRQAPGQQAVLNQQLAQMRSLQAQAQLLQQQPTISLADASRLLQESMQTLADTASISINSHIVTVTFSHTPPQALAQWMQQARSSARATPVQAQLSRTPQGWSGQMTWHLPQQGGQP